MQLLTHFPDRVTYMYVPHHKTALLYLVPRFFYVPHHKTALLYLVPQKNFFPMYPATNCYRWSLDPYHTENFLYKLWKSEGFFQFKININVVLICLTNVKIYS